MHTGYLSIEMVAVAACEAENPHRAVTPAFFCPTFGGVAILDAPNGKSAIRELGGSKVLADYRPKAGIRITPHVYTTGVELDHTLPEIRSIVQ